MNEWPMCLQMDQIISVRHVDPLAFSRKTHSAVADIRRKANWQKDLAR